MTPDPKAKPSILLYLCWQRSSGADRFIHYDEVTAEVGLLDPPTQREMQSIMRAAQMEFARLSRKRTRR